MFYGTSIKWGAIPMDNLVAHLTLDDGVLRFMPLDFGVADGQVITHMTVDVTGSVAKAEGEFAARAPAARRFRRRVGPGLPRAPGAGALQHGDA